MSRPLTTRRAQSSTLRLREIVVSGKGVTGSTSRSSRARSRPGPLDATGMHAGTSTRSPSYEGCTRDPPIHSDSAPRSLPSDRLTALTRASCAKAGAKLARSNSSTLNGFSIGSPDTRFKKVSMARPPSSSAGAATSQQEPLWAHLWSHPHAFVRVQRRSGQCCYAGHGRGRGLADSHP
jgi:hypothetical protein